MASISPALVLNVHPMRSGQHHCPAVFLCLLQSPHAISQRHRWESSCKWWVLTTPVRKMHVLTVIASYVSERSPRKLHVC